MRTQYAPLVIPLTDTGAGLPAVGGKGASLARLAGAGLPVPGGFCVTTEAYRRFVAEAGLAADIRAAVAGVRIDDPDAAEAAARRIREAFAAREMPAETTQAIAEAYARLADGDGAGGDTAVAVRSSATAEDLPDASFAGQQDTYLNIHGAGAVQDAVRRCWASLWTARAMIYRARRGIAPDEVSIAVVVQQLVPAEAAGVLFTADPQTGDTRRMVVNASWGLGESVVSGQVTPDTLVLDPSSGRVLEQHLGDKTVMTVRAPEGIREQPVPDELRAAPVLDATQAGELAGIGTRIARLYGGPVDIEWALHDGHFAVVQARPITVVGRELEVWNDSRDGDFLWSNGNLGEAIPDVMTPCTWSLVQVFMARAMATASLPGLRAYGRIGGRFYMNISLTISLGAAFGISTQRMLAAIEPAFGVIPPGVEAPARSSRCYSRSARAWRRCGSPGAPSPPSPSSWPRWSVSPTRTRSPPAAAPTARHWPASGRCSSVCSGCSESSCSAPGSSPATGTTCSS